VRGRGFSSGFWLVVPGAWDWDGGGDKRVLWRFWGSSIGDIRGGFSVVPKVVFLNDRLAILAFDCLYILVSFTQV